MPVSDWLAEACESCTRYASLTKSSHSRSRSAVGRCPSIGWWPVRSCAPSQTWQSTPAPACTDRTVVAHTFSECDTISLSMAISACYCISSKGTSVPSIQRQLPYLVMLPAFSCACSGALWHPGQWATGGRCTPVRWVPYAIVEPCIDHGNVPMEVWDRPLEHPQSRVRRLLNLVYSDVAHPGALLQIQQQGSSNLPAKFVLKSMAIAKHREQRLSSFNLINIGYAKHEPYLSPLRHSL